MVGSSHGARSWCSVHPGSARRIVIALGREAIRQSYAALFTTAQALMAALVTAHSEGRLDDRLAFYAKPKLLICEWATSRSRRMPRTCSSSSSRGATSAAASSSCRTTRSANGAEVCGDAVVATAILDRLLNHSDVLTITGESYRLSEKRRAGALKFPTPKPVASETRSQAST